jgi:hypothetical protein
MVAWAEVAAAEVAHSEVQEVQEVLALRIKVILEVQPHQHRRQVAVAALAVLAKVMVRVVQVEP